jgi:hypothetical protein
LSVWVTPSQEAPIKTLKSVANASAALPPRSPADLLRANDAAAHRWHPQRLRDRSLGALSDAEFDDLYRLNQRWIADMKRKGYTIIDAGAPTGLMERRF